MNVQKWSTMANRHRREITVLAMLTTFTAAALLIDRPKGTVLEWLAVPILVVGGALFAWAVWPSSQRSSEGPRSVASRLLRWVTLDGHLVPFFPAIGVAIILADLGYNWMWSASPAIQTEDTIVLLAAASLIGYNFVPTRFARERDFVILFSGCLNAILVVPLLVARAYYADFERSVDLYSWVALAPQTSAVLSVLGVANSVHAVVGSTAPGLTFVPQQIQVQVTVVITTSCSGIYSFGIFASAFVAFVLTEHQGMSRRVWLLLGLGLLAAYVANVLRMVVIVLVGYYTDTSPTDLQNMLIAHSYAGWLIFLGWISLFWTAVFRLLPKGLVMPQTEQVASPFQSLGARCGICSGVLTPIVPAVRCACGAAHHHRCLHESGRCPECGRPAGIKPLQVRSEN
jgi:exosortase/archaeosortase family protein